MRSKQATFTGDARRAQIVECAIETIAEVGYTQASIRKIADRVGIAMSAVLYHFGTKDKLVEAVIEHMYRTALAVVVPAIAAESTAAAKLSAYIRASVEYFDTNRVHLVALTQLSAGYRPSDGRRFDEFGLNPELTTELAALRLHVDPGDRSARRRVRVIPSRFGSNRAARRRRTPLWRRSCASPSSTYAATAKIS